MVVATGYQDGSVFQAGTPITSPKADVAHRLPLGKKLTRVLEATMNGPLKGSGSQRQTRKRPHPHQEENGVTGGTTAIFHAGTAPRQRYPDS